MTDLDGEVVVHLRRGLAARFHQVARPVQLPHVGDPAHRRASDPDCRRGSRSVDECRADDGSPVVEGAEVDPCADERSRGMHERDAVDDSDLHRGARAVQPDVVAVDRSLRVGTQDVHAVRVGDAAAVQRERVLAADGSARVQSSHPARQRDLGGLVEGRRCVDAAREPDQPALPHEPADVGVIEAGVQEVGGREDLAPARGEALEGFHRSSIAASTYLATSAQGICGRAPPPNLGAIQ